MRESTPKRDLWRLRGMFHGCYEAADRMASHSSRDVSVRGIRVKHRRVRPILAACVARAETVRETWVVTRLVRGLEIAANASRLKPLPQGDAAGQGPLYREKEARVKFPVAGLERVNRVDGKFTLAPFSPDSIAAMGRS